MDAGDERLRWRTELDPPMVRSSIPPRRSPSTDSTLNPGQTGPGSDSANAGADDTTCVRQAPPGDPMAVTEREGAEGLDVLDAPIHAATDAATDGDTVTAMAVRAPPASINSRELSGGVIIGPGDGSGDANANANATA
eukprot:m.109401 g.109401  ORF g.109401 m.109401 type:complete len:138 (-) comp21262_c1_seq1:122-535(-)